MAARERDRRRARGARPTASRAAMGQLAVGLDARPPMTIRVERRAQRVEVRLVVGARDRCSGPAARRSRMPSSSVGSPNIAGSGAGWLGVVGRERALCGSRRAMNLAIAGPKPLLQVRRRGRRGSPRAPPRGPAAIGASGGSCATRIRTSSGCAATRASAFTAPPLLAKMSTGPAAERLDQPVQVVGVLLGRRLARRVGLRAAFDAARVVGHDRAVGEVPGQRREAARAHRRADHSSAGSVLESARGRRRSGRRRAPPGCGSSARSSWSSLVSRGREVLCEDRVDLADGLGEALLHAHREDALERLRGSRTRCRRRR